MCSYILTEYLDQRRVSALLNQIACVKVWVRYGAFLLLSFLSHEQEQDNQKRTFCNFDQVEFSLL